jgi:hypothetical protein
MRPHPAGTWTFPHRNLFVLKRYSAELGRYLAIFSLHNCISSIPIFAVVSVDVSLRFFLGRLLSTTGVFVFQSGG